MAKMKHDGAVRANNADGKEPTVQDNARSVKSTTPSPTRSLLDRSQCVPWQHGASLRSMGGAQCGADMRVCVCEVCVRCVCDAWCATPCCCRYLFEESLFSLPVWVNVSEHRKSKVFNTRKAFRLLTSLCRKNYQTSKQFPNPHFHHGVMYGVCVSGCVCASSCCGFPLTGSWFGFTPATSNCATTATWRPEHAAANAFVRSACDNYKDTKTHVTHPPPPLSTTW